MKRNNRWLCAVGSALLTLYALNGGAIQAAEYIVRADDKLKIKIFQYPELSGEYAVSANGTISIAAIGDIPVDGFSTREVANRISERFIRAGLSDKPGASVEVLQSRPVYVLGDVQKPGEYAFRPGVTVLQAISLAGGWFRFNDPGAIRGEREAITIKGELRNLVRRYYQLVARRARLNAELVMNRDVQFPPDLIRQAQSDAALSQLIDEERSLLNLHVEAVKTEIESLQRTRDLYEREIAAVSRQIQANKVQYDSVGNELKDVKILVKRGLTTVIRQMNLERQQAQIEMNEQGYQTLILRARQGISQVDQRIFDLRSKLNSSATAELQQTRNDLDDVGIKFETSQSLLVEARLTMSTLVSSSDDVVETRSLKIVRVQDGKAESIEAEEHTELLPGDVLRVQRSVIPTSLGLHQPIPRNIGTQPSRLIPPMRSVVTQTKARE
jgi:polysaccharide biosynthesis/export protein ExoF